MSESDTMFNERDRRCAAVQLMLSTDPSYDNRTIASTSKCKSGLPRITGTCPGWWKECFRLRLWTLYGFKWGPRHATSHLQSRLESQHENVPGCAEECGDPLVQPRWPVADPGCGSRTRHRPTSPNRPRFGFRRSATTLYPSLTPPRPEPADYYFVWSYIENITNMTSHNTKASLIAAICRVFAEYSPSSRRR